MKIFFLDNVEENYQNLKKQLESVKSEYIINFKRVHDGDAMFPHGLFDCDLIIINDECQGDW